LPPGLRSDRAWHYALLGESIYYDWRQQGARMAELLQFSRARPVPSASMQTGLQLG
jgi:type III restriction enzyme